VIYPIEATRRNLAALSSPLISAKSSLIDQTSGSELQEFWQLLVEEYSRLKLTHQTDRLPALSGIAATVAGLLSNQLGGEQSRPNTYLAGIWSKDLPAALYWTCSPGSRRPSRYRAPTFSWASIEGPVTYYKADTADRGYGRSVCEVLGHSSTVHGLDPHGKFRASHIELRGWAGIARVTRLYGESDGERATICVVKQNDKAIEGQEPRCRRQAFYTDVSPRSGTASNPEVMVGDEVLILLLECVKNQTTIHNQVN